jgi:anti-sigma regulatory factor (Ser/Thr protein kinase)
VVGPSNVEREDSLSRWDAGVRVAGSELVTPAALPQASDGVLLACWFGPAMLGPAREQIRVLATGQGLRAAQAHRFVLAVHQAVANAVRHGGGHGQLLVWRRDGRLWCEISDHGPGLATHDPSSIQATTGTAPAGWSGLQIIRQVCTSMDVTNDSSAPACC